MSTNLKNIWISPLFAEKIKLKLKKVLFITGTWVLGGLFFTVNELLKTRSLSAEIFQDSGISNSIIIITILIITTIVGLVTGSFEAFISEKRYDKLHLGKLIIYNAGFYLLLYFGLFILGVFIYRKLFLPGSISISDYYSLVLNYLFSSHALLSTIIFGTFVSFSLFLLHTREKFGSNIMSSFLSGKYFYPKEENRIFMFLDIKSATAIAEKLGALEYHKFLNDFYHEITYPILFKKGEIYQYVGDEITISWSEKNGLKNSNCIECFFEIENTILNASQKFKNKYGLVPEFKAGIHIGSTVTGEIGIIKREIVYSGDTLNSAARIQSLCNSFGEKMIISKELLNRIYNQEDYKVRDLGECELRGRKAKIFLYGITKGHDPELLFPKSDRLNWKSLKSVISK